MNARERYRARSSRARSSGFVNLRWILLGIAAIAGSGCVTASVVLPDAAPVSTVGGGTPIELAEVKDARPTTDAGSAGLATFRAGTELDDYLRKGMASRLAALKFSIVDASNPANIADHSAVEFKGKIIQITLVSANASSSDALLQASECEPSPLAPSLPESP